MPTFHKPIHELCYQAYSQEIEYFVSKIAEEFSRVSHIEASSISLELRNILVKRLACISVGAFLDIISSTENLKESSALRTRKERIYYISREYRREYPELERVSLHVLASLTEQVALLMRRFVRDHKVLCSHFGLIECDLKAIGVPFSDFHENQSCVYQLRVGNKYLLYKPRGLHPEELFEKLRTALFSSIPEIDCATPRQASMDSYGWVEYVSHNPCRTLKDSARYLYRLGFLMSLMVFLRTSDIHRDNLIVDFNNPLLVDLECSLLPELVCEEVGRRRFSAKNTGLIGSFVDTPGYYVEDVGALSTPGRQTLDLCWLCNEGTPELVYRERQTSQSSAYPLPVGSLLRSERLSQFLLRGYVEGSRAIRKQRELALDIVASYSKNEFRVVLRDTRYYSQLLTYSLSPEFVRDGQRRRELLSAYLEEASSVLSQAVQVEIDSLMNAEIPKAMHVPSRKTLFMMNKPMNGLISNSGLEMVTA